MLTSCLLLAAGLGQSREWSSPSLLCLILDRRVNESSGIAPSRVKSTAYYTHNDSGDEPRFFKFGVNGVVSGWYRVKNATAVDWEDMATAIVEGKPHVFLADIGDNPSKRESIAIYRVPEPSGPFQELVARRYVLRYPDGAHDAEAFFVHPQTGDFTIVTKERKAPVSYVYTLPFVSAEGTYTLRKIGELAFGSSMPGGKLVTAADVSPDGRHVIVRTYTNAYEYAAPARFDDWCKQAPDEVPLAVEVQGEAICYSLDGRSILTSSEYAPCAVSVVRMR